MIPVQGHFWYLMLSPFYFTREYVGMIALNGSTIKIIKYVEREKQQRGKN